MDVNELNELKASLCIDYQRRIDNQIRDLWKEINAMKKWVIMGMSGLVIQMVATVLTIVIK